MQRCTPGLAKKLLAAVVFAAATPVFSQAIDPVNIAGEKRPAAASPALAPTPAVPAAAAPQTVAPPAVVAPAPAPVVTSVPPAPAIPVAPPVSAGPGSSGNQAVVPVDVAPKLEPIGTVVAPAAPVITPVAPVAPATPAAPTPVAAPATPATPVAPTPALAPATPVVETPAMPVAPVVPAAPVTPVVGTEPAASAPAVANADEGKPYDITGILIDYKNPHPQHPAIADLLNTQIKLGVLNDGYVAAKPGIPTTTVRLGDIGKVGPQKIHRSGIGGIYGHIVRYFNAKGIIGVFVVVDAADIDASDADIRPADRKTLQFIVVTSTVKQVRTVGIGETSDANRVDNARHKFISDKSPLKAAVEGQSGTTAKDLLMKDALDEYVLRLNRQQGRRVDVAVSGTGEPGGVTLDYLVSENRPWYVYAQISNTGTEQTNIWRERFGFVNNQLTGHDDVLSLDYMTAGFEASHAVIASYERPFFDLDRVRYKAYASWNQFTASDVGQSSEQFNGSQWTAGNELIWNFFQKRELFIDAVAGFRYSGVEVDNQTLQQQGQGNFFEPYIGLKLDRATDIATTTASATLVGYITDDSQQSIDRLGRLNTSSDPVVLQFDLGQSAYLEPLLDPRNFANGSSTLAHEVFVGVRGQWAFNNRLFPQAQDVAGGFYSVRGYPESIVAGDSVVVATAEYRFHLPRVLAVQADPSKTPLPWDKNFRFSPQSTYGRPDWDLIFRGFVDAAQVNNSSRQAGTEVDSTLLGTGVGVEFQYKQNFNLRVDWGVALRDLNLPDDTSNVKEGSNRFHISATILY